LEQIEALRSQLDNFSKANAHPFPLPSTPEPVGGRDIRELLDSLSDSIPPRTLTNYRLTPDTSGGRDVRVLLDALSDSIANSDIIPLRSGPTDGYPRPDLESGGRDVRVLLDALSDSIAKSEIRSRMSHLYDVQGPARPRAAPEDGPDFRVLLDQMAEEGPQMGRGLAGRMFASPGLSREPVYAAERDRSLRNRFGPGPSAPVGPRDEQSSCAQDERSVNEKPHQFL
jgi:hypothetical protein